MFRILKINIGDIYREQRSKYDFVSKFPAEKILDITFGKFFDFTKSEILLSKGTKEVWSLDLLNNDQYLTIRKLNNQQKVCYQKKDIAELDHTKFDAIFSFNILQISKNIEPLLEIIQNCLSDKGIAVISILNSDSLINIENNLNSSKEEYLSLDDFKNSLKSFFTNVLFYSQGDTNQLKKFTETVRSKNTMVNTKSLIKHNIKKIFKTNEKLTKFYLDYVFTSFQRYKKFRRQKKFQIHLKKYDIVPFNNHQTPLSIIAVCKKF